MPFPFLPVGAIVSIVILGTALTLFILGMLAIDRAVTATQASILPGMVRGVRAWGTALRLPVGVTSTGSGPTPVAHPASEPDLEDIPASDTVATERVRLR
jgi:hypothetical protein